MRLLVTRPMPDAAATAERIRQMGHEAAVFPLVKPQFHPLEGHHDPAAILVTSRSGVRAMAAWPKARAWRGKRVFAVGAATARAASEAGFLRVIAADGDARSLAVAVMKQVQPTVGPLFYPAGRDRGTHLEETLSFAGYELDVAVAYSMVAVERLDPELVAAITSGRIDGVVVYSPRSAEILVDLISAAGLFGQVADWVVYALSGEIGQTCRERGFSRISVAEMPREDALIQRLGRLP